MELQKFFKDYMNDYKGLDIYRETVDGQYFNEWNYEDGCLLLGCKKMYEVTGDDFYREYIIRFMDPYVKEDGEIRSYVLSEYNLQENCFILCMMRPEKNDGKRQQIS